MPVDALIATFESMDICVQCLCLWMCLCRGLVGEMAPSARIVSLLDFSACSKLVIVFDFWKTHPWMYT